LQPPTAEVRAEQPPAERERRGSSRLELGIVVGLVVVLCVPLVVALVSLHGSRWYPLLDMAGTEMRLRDISAGHPPLIGLFGRIGTLTRGGSHPGPLSFYALWPVWRLFGGSSFGLYVSMVALDMVAIGLSIWMAWRRGGLAVAAGVAAALAVLMRAYGTFLLTLAWNPYIPVLWWFVFLLAAWSVLDDDLAMAPIGLLAAAMCMQTHIPYLGLAGGTAACVGAIAIYRVVARRRPGARRSVWWLVGGATLFAVLWVPPLVDQITHSPGNFSVIYQYFRSPPEPPIGLARGVGVFLSQLNPVKLVSSTIGHDGLPLIASGSRVPGALLLAAFVGSAVVAVRCRARTLIQLDIVLGIATLLGVVSAARIFGLVFDYLLLWAWGLTALMLFAVGWSIVVLVSRYREKSVAQGQAGAVQRSRQILVGALGAVVVVALSAFTVSASHAHVQMPRINSSVAVLAPATAQTLRSMRADGERGPYLVTWLPDEQALGAQGFGLVDALERDGLNVRTDAQTGRYQPDDTPNHALDPAAARVEVHLATGGPQILKWERDARFHEIARYDGRTAAERSEYAHLRAQLISALRRAGMTSLVPRVDTDLLGIYWTDGIPRRAHDAIARMFTLGVPAAVFVGTPRQPD
jgi:hypothetical protein